MSGTNVQANLLRFAWLLSRPPPNPPNPVFQSATFYSDFLFDFSVRLKALYCLTWPVLLAVSKHRPLVPAQLWAVGQWQITHVKKKVKVEHLKYSNNTSWVHLHSIILKKKTQIWNTLCTHLLKQQWSLATSLQGDFHLSFLWLAIKRRVVGVHLSLVCLPQAELQPAPLGLPLAAALKSDHLSPDLFRVCVTVSWAVCKKKKKKVSNWHSTGVTFLTLKDWLCQARVRFPQPQNRAIRSSQQSKSDIALTDRTRKCCFISQLSHTSKCEKILDHLEEQTLKRAEVRNI